MENSLKRFLIAIIYLIVSGPYMLSAQVSAVYGGGDFYSGGQAVMNDLRSSGLNTVILWTLHVGPQGNMNFNDIPVINTNGEYIGDPNWQTRLATLKQAPTSIDRIELGVASAGVNDFENIEALINAHGIGPQTNLYKAFDALKTITGADAINIDDESHFQVASMVQFCLMMDDIGYKIAFVPYNRQSFWIDVYNQVEAARPGAIDRIYLQVYAGGSGNNPASWNTFGSLKVIPGLWSKHGNNCVAGDSPAQVQSRMASWKNDISGGFMWLYEDIQFCAASGNMADYANAINTALEPIAGGATNLAPNATISVSSEFADPNWSKERLTDGIIGQNANGEWASGGEQTPWAQLNWNTAVITDKIILYDRPNPTEIINEGTLTFSDGSSVNVSALPNNGLAKEVSFPAKNVNWVRFTVTHGVGPNVGLSEFQVFESSASVPPSGQTPFNGTPSIIPGIIESENYDNGGQGVAYNDSNPNSNNGGQYRPNEGVDIAIANEGGFQIGWTVAGEWQEYTVNVASAGTYNAAIRYAANAGNTGGVRLEFNGVDKSGTVALPVTNGWQTFQTVNVPVILDAGEQILRVFTVTAGINLNKINFTLNSNPSTGTSITLGNSTTPNGLEDSWRSNMLVNESDTYRNNSGSPQQIQINEFNFYAYREADPLTPFVVRVNGDNNFTVLAVGTTRTRNNYNAGQNTLAFNDGTPVSITLNDGETIATGYLDANANGSGGLDGSVIPFDQSAGADELWYTGGPNSNESGSVTVGNSPTAGNNTLTNLRRNYRYQIVFEVFEGNNNARFENSIENELVEEINDLEIYPNPFFDHLLINLPQDNEYVAAEIVSLSGQLLARRKINEGEYVIELKTYNQNEKGLFILRLIGTEKVFTKRLIRK